MTRSRPSTAAAALAALLSMSCAEPLTQAILVVDTNVPRANPSPDTPVQANQIREISISLYGPCSEDGSSCPPIFEDNVQRYTLPGAAPLPFSIGLLLEPDAELGPYLVDVRATLGPPESESEIDVEAEFIFVRGETRVVPLHLLGTCIGVPCPRAESCGVSGTCESSERSGAGFPPWTDNLEDFAL